MVKNLLVCSLAVPFTLLIMWAEWLLYIGSRDLRMTHRVARSWGRGMLRLCGLRVRVEGSEHLRPDVSYVLVANHSSMLDILILLGYVPVCFRWLAKKELFRIPLFGASIRMIGAVPVDRANPRAAFRSMRAALKGIQDGASLMIFPEGTRSPDGRVRGFKPGAFHLAAQARCPVVPLVIVGAHRALPRGRLRIRRVPLRLIVTRPIVPPGSRSDKTYLARMSEERIVWIQEQYERRRAER